MNSYHLPTLAELSPSLVAELRSDHAGETGAVYIYKGILAGTKLASLREFAAEHLRTEQRHLDFFDSWLRPQDKSVFIILWRLAGWCLGFISALAGPNAVFASIDVVERFVVQHYQQQIATLQAHSQWPEVAAVLQSFMHDEAAHREDAANRAEPQAGPILQLWLFMVEHGSALAVAVARRC